jgi:hypothetical protein
MHIPTFFLALLVTLEANAQRPAAVLNLEVTDKVATVFVKHFVVAQGDFQNPIKSHDTKSIKSHGCGYLIRIYCAQRD